MLLAMLSSGSSSSPTGSAERSTTTYRSRVRHPLLVGLLVRPRRIGSLSYSFNQILDQQTRSLAFQADLGQDLVPRLTPFGLVMKYFDGEALEVQV